MDAAPVADPLLRVARAKGPRGGYPRGDLYRTMRSGFTRLPVRYHCRNSHGGPQGSPVRRWGAEPGSGLAQPRCRTRKKRSDRMASEPLPVAEDQQNPRHPLPSASREPRRLGLALVVIAAAQLMIVLDATIVNVALPHIQRALGFSGSGLEWVVTAYSLAFGSLLLLRRPARRHLRPAARVHRRHRDLLARLAARRPGHERVVDPRGPRRAGSGRRAGRADRARPDRHDLPGRAAAQPGLRRLRRHERRRRRHRSAAGRHPHDLRVVALGVLRQRADRHRRAGAGADRPGADGRARDCASTFPACSRAAPAWRLLVYGLTHAAAGRDGVSHWGSLVDDRRAGRGRGAARRPSCRSSAAAAIPSCRCTCSSRVAARAPTS